MRKDARERVEIEHAFTLISLNHMLQLGGRRPKNRVFEECSRRIRGIGVDGFVKLSRTLVEIRHAYGRTGVMPFTIEMAGWDESQLVGEISERGWR